MITPGEKARYNAIGQLKLQGRAVSLADMQFVFDLCVREGIALSAAALAGAKKDGVDTSAYDAKTCTWPFKETA